MPTAKHQRDLYDTYLRLLYRIPDEIADGTLSGDEDRRATLRRLRYALVDTQARTLLDASDDVRNELRSTTKAYSAFAKLADTTDSDQVTVQELLDESFNLNLLPAVLSLAKVIRADLERESARVVPEASGACG